MLTDTKAIMNKVLNAFRNDPILSDCVKSFSLGNLNFSRKQFPFIEIGNFSYAQSDLRAGSGRLIYSIDIYAGTRNLAPGVAFQGSESGKVGISELCERIVVLAANNTFGNAFFMPVINISNNPRFLHDKAETLYIGKVSFTGEVRIQYL